MAIFDFHLPGVASFVIQERGVRFPPAIHERVFKAIGNHWRQISFKSQMPGTDTRILEIHIPVRIILGRGQKRRTYCMSEIRRTGFIFPVIIVIISTTTRALIFIMIEENKMERSALITGNQIFRYDLPQPRETR